MYWVPAPKPNWLEPAGRVADQLPGAPLAVSGKVAATGPDELRVRKLTKTLSGRPSVLAWKVIGVWTTPPTSLTGLVELAGAPLTSTEVTVKEGGASPITLPWSGLRSELCWLTW